MAGTFNLQCLSNVIKCGLEFDIAVFLKFENTDVAAAIQCTSYCSWMSKWFGCYCFPGLVSYTEKPSSSNVNLLSKRKAFLHQT
jgi:hypothetical protein